MPRCPPIRAARPSQQFLFVNGRPVLDRLLLGALRAAYFDVLSRDRHPAAVLNLICDPQRVDVNVHPAKAEVRFREPDAARSLIITGLRTALAEGGHRASTTVGAATLDAFRPEPRIYQMDRPSPARAQPRLRQRRPPWVSPRRPPRGWSRVLPSDGPLGAARAQLHENYIIAQTATGMVIVDQHAAHERLVYERLKRQMAETGIAAQALLIPEIVDLIARRRRAPPGRCARACAGSGCTIEPFGGSAVAVRETPAVLGPVDAQALLARHPRRTGRPRRQPACAGADRRDPVAHGLPRLGPLGPPDARRGDERPSARDGGDARIPASATTAGPPMWN